MPVSRARNPVLFHAVEYRHQPSHTLVGANAAYVADRPVLATVDERPRIRYRHALLEPGRFAFRALGHGTAPQMFDIGIPAVPVRLRAGARVAVLDRQTEPPEIHIGVLPHPLDVLDG